SVHADDEEAATGELDFERKPPGELAHAADHDAGTMRSGSPARPGGIEHALALAHHAVVLVPELHVDLAVRVADPFARGGRRPREMEIDADTGLVCRARQKLRDDRGAGSGPGNSRSRVAKVRAVEAHVHLGLAAARQANACAPAI